MTPPGVDLAAAGHYMGAPAGRIGNGPQGNMTLNDSANRTADEKTTAGAEPPATPAAETAPPPRQEAGAARPADTPADAVTAAEAAAAGEATPEDTGEDAGGGTGEDATPQDRIAELEAELASLNDRLLRALAETDNVRKRALKDREDAARFASRRFAEDMLAVADNLRRALEAGAEQGLVEGVELTVKELDTVFQRHGIERVVAAGARFDPNLHQAMFEQETDRTEAGAVAQVLRDGYTIHGRLLRPAMVAVAKAPAPPPAED